MQATPTNNEAGSPFIELNTVDSTNNYAMGLINNGDPVSGTVIFAWDQTHGKGQRGKQWLSAPKMNIIMSLMLNVSRLPVSRQFVLSAGTALVLHDFFDRYAGGGCTIKWPNDLYWRDRKAGGILIENIIRGQEWQWAILGIGVNINQTVFDNNVKNAVSLKQITGRDFDALTMTKEIAALLSKNLKDLDKKDDQQIVDQYNARLYKRGQAIRLKKNNIAFNCVLQGANTFGQLVVQAGTEQVYNVGEIEWQIDERT